MKLIKYFIALSLIVVVLSAILKQKQCDMSTKCKGNQICCTDKKENKTGLCSEEDTVLKRCADTKLFHILHVDDIYNACSATKNWCKYAPKCCENKEQITAFKYRCATSCNSDETDITKKSEKKINQEKPLFTILKN
jgi:hypothetical protein